MRDLLDHLQGDKRGAYIFTRCPGSSMAQWLKDNGFQTREDLRFAFADKEDAARAGGSEVAELWEEAQRGEAKQKCCWDILLIERTGREDKPKSAPAAPPVVRWKGVKPNAAARILSDDKDAADRKSIAKQLVNIAKTWKKSTLLADVYSDEQEQAMWLRTEDRVAQFESSSTKARLRTWISWTRWAKNRSMQPLGAPATAIQEFVLHNARAGTTSTESAPRARWDHLKWMAVYLGAPVNLPAWTKPQKKVSTGGVKSSQAVAADPEVLLQMEQTVQRLPEDDPHVVPILGALTIAYSVLRFRHVQRSVLTQLCKVTIQGVCTRGKGRPGFRWSMPRYGPLGTDIGRMLWNQWTAICSSGIKRFLVFDRANGGALALNEFHRAVRSSLSTHSGMSNPEIYSSYSSRRCMPTIAMMRGAAEEETCALGEWQGKEDKSMPVRYAESIERQATATIAKLTQCQIISIAADKSRPVSWEALRKCVGQIDIDSVKKAANAAFCENTEVESTPQAWLKDIVQPVKRFALTGLAL